MTANPWNDDPWADEPQGSIADNPWDTYEAPADDVDDKKETPVSERPTSEGKISITFKQHRDFDAPWIVVYAADAADAERQLLEIKSGNLLKAVSVVAGEFAAAKSGGRPTVTANVQQAPAQQAPQQQAPQQARPQQNVPAWSDGRSCVHGVMVAREGYNAEKDNHWKAYFCPTPKGTQGQCKGVFVK